VQMNYSPYKQLILVSSSVIDVFVAVPSSQTIRIKLWQTGCFGNLTKMPTNAGKVNWLAQ